MGSVYMYGICIKLLNYVFREVTYCILLHIRFSILYQLSPCLIERFLFYCIDHSLQPLLIRNLHNLHTRLLRNSQGAMNATI